MDVTRKLPVGIQDFEKLREENYLYVDKTQLVYDLAHCGNGCFLARPRCFGKSLLLSTLEAYFKGRKDLFEGLRLEALEEDWQEYPVLRIDFATDVYAEEGTLEVTLNTFLTEQEHRYGRHEERTTYARRFEHIIRRAYETSGKPVVVLIDDYDKPIQDALFSPVESHNRDLLRNFYAALNGNDYYLKFVFITGITKFASVNIFNGASRLRDISMYEEFNALCGFTPQEVEEAFAPELQYMTARHQRTTADFMAEFSGRYSGYRFCRHGTEVYNPCSVVGALEAGELVSPWFQTGIPSMLIKMLQNSGYDMFNIIEGISIDADALMEYRWTEDDLISIIYQSGFLTIAGWDAETNLVALALPNREVRDGFLKCLLPFYTKIGATSRYGMELALLHDQLSSGDTAGVIARMSTALAGLPALQKKPEQAERLYQLVFHTLLTLTGYPLHTGTRIGGGRNDIVVEADGHIYIFGLKTDRGIPVEDVEADALARIEERAFAAPYAQDARTLHRVAVVCSPTSGIAGWKEE